MSDAPEVATSEPRPRPRRGRTVVIAVAGLLAIVAAVLIVARPSRTDRLDDALAVVEDDSRHESALESAESLGRAVSLLRGEAANCSALDKRDGAKPADTRCLARNSLAAYAQVVSVEAIRCTAAGRHDLRAAIARYIRDVKAMSAGDTVPPPPPFPHCT